MLTDYIHREVLVVTHHTGTASNASKKSMTSTWVTYRLVLTITVTFWQLKGSMWLDKCIAGVCSWNSLHSRIHTTSGAHSAINTYKGGHTRTRHDAKLAVKGQDKKFKTQWSTGPIPTGISFLPIQHTDWLFAHFTTYYITVYLIRYACKPG